MRVAKLYSETERKGHELAPFFCTTATAQFFPLRHRNVRHLFFTLSQWLGGAKNGASAQQCKGRLYNVYTMAENI